MTEFAPLIRQARELGATDHQVAEILAWLFQHEETGRTTFEYAPDDADAFEKDNPRWFRVCAVYRTPPDQSARIKELERLLIRALPYVQRIFSERRGDECDVLSDDINAALKDWKP